MAHRTTTRRKIFPLRNPYFYSLFMYLSYWKNAYLLSLSNCSKCILKLRLCFFGGHQNAGKAVPIVNQVLYSVWKKGKDLKQNGTQNNTTQKNSSTTKAPILCPFCIFSIGKTHICYWCKGAEIKPQSESKFLKSGLKICLNKFKSLDKTVLSIPFQSRLLRLIYDKARVNKLSISRLFGKIITSIACLTTTSFMLQR